MLEFIVLGQIPGTQVYVPFNFVISGIALVFSLILARRLFSPLRHYKRRMQEIFDTAL